MRRWRPGAMTRVMLLAAAVVVAAGVVGALIVRQTPGRPVPAGVGVRTSSSPTLGAVDASPTGQPGQTPVASRAPLAPGKLPVPAQADVVEEQLSGTLQPLATGSTHLVLNVTSLPQPGPSLAVYRYAPGSGPADGSILDPNGLPARLASATYPAQPPADAFAAAATREAGGVPANLQLTLPVTQARLVYVAVVAGGQGYLEPAYLFSGTMRFHTIVQAQVLVPALSPSTMQ